MHLIVSGMIEILKSRSALRLSLCVTLVSHLDVDAGLAPVLASLLLQSLIVDRKWKKMILIILTTEKLSYAKQYDIRWIRITHFTVAMAIGYEYIDERGREGEKINETPIMITTDTRFLMNIQDFIFTLSGRAFISIWFAPLAWAMSSTYYKHFLCDRNRDRVEYQHDSINCAIHKTWRACIWSRWKW